MDNSLNNEGASTSINNKICFQNSEPTCSKSFVEKNNQQKPPSNTEVPRKKNRRRQKGKIKFIIQQIEALFLKPIYRRPQWFKEILDTSKDGSQKWVSLEEIIGKMGALNDSCDNDKKTLLKNKAFLHLLRGSKIFELDETGLKIRLQDDNWPEPGCHDCIIYVDNLPGNADDNFLFTVFSHYGRIIDAWVIAPHNAAAVAARKRAQEEKMQQHQTQSSKNSKRKVELPEGGHRKNRGFGFVYFADEQSVDRVLSFFRGSPKNTNISAPISEEKPTENISKSVAIADSNVENGTTVSVARKRKIDSNYEEKPTGKRICLERKREICNGEISNGEKSGAPSKTVEDLPVKKGEHGLTNVKKKKVRRKSNQQRKRLRHANEKKIGNLHVFTWSEWREFKERYLAKQKANFGRLKTQLKTVKQEQNLTKLLDRQVRYGEAKKERRGRDKLICKAERYNEIRGRQTHSDSIEVVQQQKQEEDLVQ